jgi:hypothetical protein
MACTISEQMTALLVQCTYCINSKFGGGWTLILRVGAHVDMSNNEYSAARNPENLNAITDPGLDSFYKYSTSDINMLRTSNLRASVTPMLGSGLSPLPAAQTLVVVLEELTFSILMAVNSV